MKVLRDLSFVIFIILTLSAAAFGADPVPVEADQPGYVVRVLVEFGRYNDVGTGSIIRRDLVLTANHVVADDTDTSPIWVEFLGGNRLLATVVKADKEQDLALLKIPMTLMPRILVSNAKPHTGQEVKIGGFAHGTTYKILTSNIYKWYQFDEDRPDTRAFSVRGECTTGMSGGPAITRGGLLAGVLSCADEIESYCSDAEKINNFLKDFDLIKFDGILEVEP